MVSKAIRFGALSGLCWAFVPLALCDFRNSPADILTVFLAGLLTGPIVSVTVALLFPCGQWNPLLGVASLPAGAWIFGSILAAVQACVHQLSGIRFRGDEFGFHPWVQGLQLAGGSLIPTVAVFLVPAAVLTSYALWKHVDASSTPS